MSILEAKNLSYSYDKGKLALENINLTIKKGSMTAILGGNGAGKSTLFLNLNGVLRPSGGQVFFDGEEVVYDKKGLTNLRKQVGIVFQDPNHQLFSASVESDIAFGLLNLGKAPEEVRPLVAQAAAQAGVTQLLDRPTHALSFGQKKRVAMAGVLAMEPSLIILDEPTAGLDPAGVSELLHLLLRVQKERGLSVILSTHDIDLVPLYCDFAYVLNGGKIVMEGTPSQLFENPADIRAHQLRAPRIAHLMSILEKQDGLPVDGKAATISKARASIKEAFSRE